MDEGLLTPINIGIAVAGVVIILGTMIAIVCSKIKRKCCWRRSDVKIEPKPHKTVTEVIQVPTREGRNISSMVIGGSTNVGTAQPARVNWQDPKEEQQ